METITVCTIVKNEEFFIDLMIKSVLNFVDEIIIVDDYSTDKTEEIIKNFKSDKIKYHKLNFGENNGDGRQFAYEQATSEWILWLDADEVIHEDDMAKLKYDWIKKLNHNNVDVASVEYIHFIENFSKIDNSVAIHIGVNRLHRNLKGIVCNKMKHHALPSYNWSCHILFPNLKIWHLGYLRGITKILERFERNYNGHYITHPIQDCRWRDWHYFGTYPTKPINMSIIPKVIKEKFKMEVYE